jgi:HlyD family secretion protein
MKKLFLAILLLALASFIAWRVREWFIQSTGELKLYGNVDIRGVDLGFRVGGKLVEVLKDEGDSVKAGEVIARIDPLPYQHDLAKAEAEQATAEADLALKSAGYRAEEIEQARAAVEESHVIVRDARSVRERHAALLGGGGTSKQNVESAQAALDEAEQRVKVAEAKLKLLEAGFRPEEIAAAKARVAQAKAAVSMAKLRVEDSELKTPSDGIVLTRALEPGAVVQAGATVLSLSLENPVWVRAYVHETELGSFPSGRKVLLTTDGRPDRPYHGQVGFVSPKAEFTPKSVETPELRTSLVYRLRVVVSDADKELRQGMPVTVSLDPNTK